MLEPSSVASIVDLVLLPVVFCGVSKVVTSVEAGEPYTEADRAESLESMETKSTME